jgi:hypothetical protein
MEISFRGIYILGDAFLPDTLYFLILYTPCVCECVSHIFLLFIELADFMEFGINFMPLHATNSLQFFSFLRTIMKTQWLMNMCNISDASPT